jgi:hypothetical protein
VAAAPVPEQRRLVKLVDELLRLCDELEQRRLGERALAAELAESAISSLVAQIA